MENLRFGIWGWSEFRLLRNNCRHVENELRRNCKKVVHCGCSVIVAGKFSLITWLRAGIVDSRSEMNYYEHGSQYGGWMRLGSGMLLMACRFGEKHLEFKLLNNPIIITSAIQQMACHTSRPSNKSSTGLFPIVTLSTFHTSRAPPLDLFPRGGPGVVVFIRATWRDWLWRQRQRQRQRGQCQLSGKSKPGLRLEFAARSESSIDEFKAPDSILAVKYVISTFSNSHIFDNDFRLSWYTVLLYEFEFIQLDP